MISLFKDTNYKRYVLQFAIIFCITMVLGIILGMYVLPHGVSNIVVNHVVNQSATSKIMDLGNDNIFLECIIIFVNNMIVALLFAFVIPFFTYFRSKDVEKDKKQMMTFSRLIFGAQMTIIFVVVGYYMNYALVVKSIWWVISALAPHGIFEIPAIIMSASFGLWYIQNYRLTQFKNAISTFGYYIVPLFAIAAIIETFITPVIMKMVS